MLEIDTQELASLLIDLETPARADAAPRRGLFLGEATAPFVDAVWRLMRLLDTPGDIRALAPLAEREVLYRLLQSNADGRLRMWWRETDRRAGSRIDCVAAFALRRATARGAPGRGGAHEPVVIPRPLQTRHRDEPAAVSEAVAAAGSPPPADDRRGRCRHSGAPRGVSKPQPVQPRVSPRLRHVAGGRLSSVAVDKSAAMA